MLSVLHADGNRDVRETCSQLFASRGIPSRASAGGVDCMHQLREQAPGLLILDHDLPWGGGPGVLGVMREDPKLRHIPVVMTTGASPVEKRDQVAVWPIVKSLAKPFRAADLLEEIAGRQKVEFLTNGLGAPATDSLVKRMEKEIQTLTWQRVQDLRVESVHGAVLVYGRVPNFYAKQLVLIAAMRVLDGSGLEPRFDVEVDSRA